MSAFRTFALFVVFWLTLFSNSGLSSDSPSNYCENFLSLDDPPEESPPKLLEHEIQVGGLIDGYLERLGPHWDPFALVFSPEQGDRLFKRLSERLKDGKKEDSSLAIINRELKKAYLGKNSYNDHLMESILTDIADGLSQPRIDQRDLQSNLLALKFSMEYLHRFKTPEKIVDREGEDPDREPEEKESEEENQDPEDEEDWDPEYPELPDEYKPSTVDTQKEKGKKQKKVRVAEVNFRTPFFAQRYFSNVVRGADLPFSKAVLPGMLTRPSQSKSTEKEMILRTFGRKKGTLFLPPGFKPLQPKDPRASITRSETGEYLFELKEDLSEIEIPLVDDNRISMKPPMREVFTRPVGFHVDEWPDEIQADILRHYPEKSGETKPLEVAQAISNHIATEYLYSVGSRPEKDPIDALKAGAFQCDMAAYAMVGLLRDVYQIPSRVVGGYRAQKYLGGRDGKSYLVLPGEAHAWVEVFHNGKWHLFDPTPVKKDKKEDQSGESDDYSDETLENTPQSEGEAQKGKPTSSDGDRKGKQDHQKRLDENTEKRTKGVEAEGKNQKSDSDGEEDETPLTTEDLADQLELGSLELEPNLEQNPLKERAMRVVLRSILDPTKTGLDIQNRLNQIGSLIKSFSHSNVKTIYQEALSAHQGDHPGIRNWIDRLVRTMPERDVNQTYQELHRIRMALRVYAKVLDHDGKIPIPTDLLATLDRAQSQMEGLAHPDSQDIGLVQDFVKNFPRVVRQLLKQVFDFSRVGPNSPTKEIAEKLRRGELNDLRLLSILSPLSDFILNSTPRPERTEVKTWQRDPRIPRGRDLLPLKRYTDMARALRGQPGKSIKDNILEGTAFVPVRRERVQIPMGYGKEEAERITIVLYDTSGSMSGDPGRFQAGLISAFTARALSDVTPSGRHRHRVVLVPFDGEPGTPVPVTNTSEAIEIIHDYQNNLKNTNGSTNIQKALLQGMSLIADAEKKSGEPLAAANIILMSDGQSEVDVDELRQARNAFDRQTPLQTMFIAINQTSEALMRFAMDSQSMGAEQGFYREFTKEHIADLLKEADHLDVEGREHFYTEESAQDLPREIYDLMNKALRLSAQFSDQVYYGSQYVPARKYLEELEKLKWRDQKHADRPLEKWLVKLRRFAYHPVFQDRSLLERMVDDLISHFEIITGVKKDSLSDHEQEHLRHFIRKAAGLETEEW